MVSKDKKLFPSFAKTGEAVVRRLTVGPTGRFTNLPGIRTRNLLIGYLSSIGGVNLKYLNQRADTQIDALAQRATRRTVLLYCTVRFTVLTAYLIKQLSSARKQKCQPSIVFQFRSSGLKNEECSYSQSRSCCGSSILLPISRSSALCIGAGKIVEGKHDESTPFEFYRYLCDISRCLIQNVLLVKRGREPNKGKIRKY